MLDVTLPSVFSFLQENQYNPELQKETSQIYLIFKSEQREYPIFFRIFEDSQQLQIMLFIPSHLKKKETDKPEISSEEETQNSKITSEIARMLHILNKEIDVPGFGMDEEAGLIFYRLVLPVINKQIDKSLFLQYVKGCEQICKLFAIPIEAVSTGQTTLADILNKAKEMGKK